jgi:hypothetical protein
MRRDDLAGRLCVISRTFQLETLLEAQRIKCPRTHYNKRKKLKFISPAREAFSNVRLFTRNLIKLFQAAIANKHKKAAPLSIRIGCGTLTYVTAFFRTWPLPILISLPAGCSFLPSGAFLSVFCVYECVCSGRGVRGTNVYYCIYIHTHIIPVCFTH